MTDWLTTLAGLERRGGIEIAVAAHLLQARGRRAGRTTGGAGPRPTARAIALQPARV